MGANGLSIRGAKDFKVELAERRRLRLEHRVLAAPMLARIAKNLEILPEPAPNATSRPKRRQRFAAETPQEIRNMSKKELDTKDPAPKSELTDDELEQVAGGVRKASGKQEAYLQIELENVQITSYQIG